MTSYTEKSRNTLIDFQVTDAENMPVPYTRPHKMIQPVGVRLGFRDQKLDLVAVFGHVIGVKGQVTKKFDSFTLSVEDGALYEEEDSDLLQIPDWLKQLVNGVVDGKEAD